MVLKNSRKGSGIFTQEKFGYNFTFFLACSGVTEKFQKISLEIIEIKKSLDEQDPPQTQAASMIARVQVTFNLVK